MGRILKQFAAWVTDLRDNAFLKTRLALVAYFMAIVIVLFAGHTWYYTDNLASEITRDVVASDQINLPQEGAVLVNVVSQTLREGIVAEMLIFVFLAGVLGYVFSGIALRTLRNVAKVQKRFIDDASHELRTPLSIMKADIELVLSDGGNQDAANLLETVRSNEEEVNRMSDIIENLLALTYRGETAQAFFSKIDLSKTVLQTVERFKKIYERSGEKYANIALQRVDPVLTWGNVSALEQMIANLLNNAYKYTPAGGVITVSLIAKYRTVELSIKDTGVGIASMDLPYIFKPFYTGMHDNTWRPKSSGLGLTLVERIVRQHGGTITIKSKEHIGTHICIKLPIMQKLEEPESEQRIERTARTSARLPVPAHPKHAQNMI